MDKLKKVFRILNNIGEILSRIDQMQQALGRIEARQAEKDIALSEFKVYSQWGEDGIIQHLIRHIEIPNKIFVEFGVEDYTEANTRFLLQNNNWTGLIMDGSEENIEKVKNDPIYWRYNLQAVSAFIDRDNINELILKNGISGDIGILSVDIDGNDYWVWEQIKVVSPRIVICEYNSLFGNMHAISVPYDKAFVRSEKHFSNLYYGASIGAFDYLASQKGYTLVASNSAGNNLFFVRDDLAHVFARVSKENAYKKAQFREARDKNGFLTYQSFEENQQVIRDEMVVNVVTGETVMIKALLDD